MTILVLEGLHGQTRHLVAVNSSTQQINYDPCLNVKILTKQDLQTHFSLLVPEWRNWRPWFPRHLSCFGSSIRYKIYSIQNQRHQCHHRACRSLLQQHLACFLLSGSPGQAPILHCSDHGCQQGQAHIISLVKILAPDANHIIIPYSCARHKARTSKKTTTNHIFEAWTLIFYSVCHSGTSLLWSGFQLQYANHNIIPYSCTYNKAKTSKI